jgi:hypothetical protein
MTRLILSILRQAAQPMTAREVAVHLCADRALDKDDPKL